MTRVWEKLERSERLSGAGLVAEVWKVGGGARFSFLSTVTGQYVDGREMPDLESAKAHCERILFGNAYVERAK